MPALVRRTSKLQRSPSWVISPSNMSVRRRLKVKADRQITLIAALFFGAVMILIGWHAVVSR